MTIAFTPRKESLSSLVYARQKAEGGIYCYFSTPKYCLTLAELADHAECNHSLVKSLKARCRTGGQFKSALQKHTSDLRIHSLAILRRSEELRQEVMARLAHFDLTNYNAVQKQAGRTYKLKT